MTDPDATATPDPNLSETEAVEIGRKLSRVCGDHVDDVIQLCKSHSALAATIAKLKRTQVSVANDLADLMIEKERTLRQQVEARAGEMRTALEVIRESIRQGSAKYDELTLDGIAEMIDETLAATSTADHAAKVLAASTEAYDAYQAMDLDRIEKASAGWLDAMKAWRGGEGV